MKSVESEEIRAFVQTSLLDGREIAMDEELLLSGLLDSMAVITLVAYLEELRGAPIPPEDVTLENFESVNAMAAFVHGA